MCFIGLNIKEVAHDYATSVSDYIISELQLLNSYDTWHGKIFEMYLNMMCILFMSCKGTKNVAKAMKKIAQGAAKWEGTKWFRDLSDKCMYMYNHVFALRTVTGTLLIFT